MKNVIVLATDKNHVNHIKYNINNIRNMHGEIDIVILHDKSYSEIINNELNKYNIIPYPVDCLKINDGPFYIKYHLFDVFFKKWENILYIDSDTMVFSNLNLIFKMLNEDNLIFAEHEKCKVLKFFTSDCPQDLNNNNIYTDLLNEKNINEQGFNSGILLYKSSIIKEDIVDKLYELHEKYIEVNKHGKEQNILWTLKPGTDQPIINLIFANIVKQMPNNYFSYYSNISDSTFISHFCRWDAPWLNERYGYRINMRYIDYYNKMLNL